ncbi:MAG TPA: 6,7-dimethyl-8-ribityllumazine synthase [Hypericibacter adhaerens]|jgi:6,7-dimethyl-8-ribityllumazine synthase|uniref:6,7-dimethyl-8-ribityllumazine synthase n=1 Tax=Hypericibacter adhaerens TaxID=2602016 RepID=UPI002BC0DE67|nr:6,7-dimethyl-8-ribityllumazine synthase [Hypericibacter adhaerens]HWA42896.1 6,7-dimethyl-8-ribityllumazine synthase [Hypericibacter adhaerens]
MARTTTSKPSAGKAGAPHVLIVESRFYDHISDELLKGATQALEAAGCSYETIQVPGAFEVPAAIRIVVEATHGVKQPFDGYVALGCVIRGETTHYDYVCGESARGLQELAIRYGLAIGYGILTVENEAQALARARVTEKNKGRDAVNACLAMVALKRKYGVDRVIETGP